ncbi:MAG: hypothetical protein LN568_01940, partial [Rickettsia endosymbiont of Pseudomimeciton antennatum]|nr:hypothetical protein [Rickettsia endosymbiont of Pseudomimeciton antennatum]
MILFSIVYSNDLKNWLRKTVRHSRVHVLAVCLARSSLVYCPHSSNHLSIQNRFFNKYLVRSCVVLFFLLQQFNASDVLAVGVNEEVGQLPYSNKIEEIFNAIDEANDKLNELKRKQLETISPFSNINELENALDSLEKDSSVLLNKQKIYDFKRQNIKEEISSSEETEQNLFVEFVENDSEEYIYDPISNPLLVESINTTELEYDPESSSNFDIEEQEQMVAKQPSSSITPSPFGRLERVHKDLANLTEDLSEMEVYSSVLETKRKEYHQQLIIIQAKDAEIRQLREENKALIEYNGLAETISYQSKSLPREISISVPDDIAVDPYEILGDNFGLERLFEEKVVPIVDKSPSESYTQPKFNDRKLIDSEDELLYLGYVSQKSSVTQGDSQLSLQEELKAADPNYRKKRNIVVHDNTTVDLDKIFKDSFELETLFEEKVVSIVTEPQSLVAEAVPVKTVKPLTLIDDPPSQIVKTDTEVVPEIVIVPEVEALVETVPKVVVVQEVVVIPEVVVASEIVAAPKVEALVETVPKVVVVQEVVVIPEVVVASEIVAAPKVEALVEVVPASAVPADAYLEGGGVVPPPERDGGVPPEGDGVVPPPLPPRGGGVPPEGDGVVPPPPPPRGGGVPP